MTNKRSAVIKKTIAAILISALFINFNSQTVFASEETQPSEPVIAPENLEPNDTEPWALTDQPELAVQEEPLSETSETPETVAPTPPAPADESVSSDVIEYPPPEGWPYPQPPQAIVEPIDPEPPVIEESTEEVSETEEISSAQTTSCEESEVTSEPENPEPITEEEPSDEVIETETIQTEEVVEETTESSIIEEQSLELPDPTAVENEIIEEQSTLTCISEDSTAEDSTEQETNIEIINTNDVTVTNELAIDDLTGANSISGNEDGEDASIQSGEINIFANVVNVLNTNTYNSEMVEIIQNFNNLSADILLNHPESTPIEATQSLLSQVCTSSLECQSLNSFALTNQNTANVANNLSILGNSGDNTIENTEERATIGSGNVNALVNILNIVNTNLVNSRWTVASINIFGDWEGDLVLPSELYFADFISIGNTPSADASLAEIDRVLIDVQNDNVANIENNVNVGADSGANGINATGDPDNDGDVEDSSITAGTSQAAANVQDITNTNVYNGKWFLGMINTLGSWSGNIYSLPEQVAVAETPTGITFFAASNASSEVIVSSLETTTQTEETDVTITNVNEANIQNNVDLGAYAGNNQISAVEVEDSSIVSGNTRALANVINFANTNLVNSDLYMGLINIFGRWQGNVLFGEPDLNINQNMVQGFPLNKNNEVKVELEYENKGNSSTDNVILEWQYDSTLLQINPGGSELQYEETAPGKVKMNLGKLAAGALGKATLSLQTLTNIASPKVFVSVAKILGASPEKNLMNNSDVLSLSLVPITAPINQEIPKPEIKPDPDLGKKGLIRIYKSNDLGGTTAKAGDRINFKIIIDNDGSDNLSGAIVHDVLRGPDGEVISTRKFPLGSLLSLVNPAATDGQYTNSAYVEAIDSKLKIVKSETTAVSTFTIRNPKIIETPLAVPENDNFSPVLLNSSQNLIPTKATAVKTKRSVNLGSGIIPHGQVASASTNSLPEPEVIQNMNGNYLYQLIFASFILSFGYALANLRDRRKKLKIKI